MHVERELTVVTVVVLALVAGAALRAVSKRTGFPFTVAMLLLGGAVGFALHGGEATHEGVSGVLGWGDGLTPHLIVFVFLPALVFESAFAIDVHSVRKNIGAIILLAVPALVVCTFVTAAMMVGLTGSSWAWSWPAALVFGALTSATDPVAVVAILREVGAPKRLAVLIEGESLANDGTAIVVFTVLFAALASGDSSSLGLADSGMSFLRVVAGGIAVGLVFGLVATTWVARTFDDPLVEITLTLVLAYASMIVAEGIFHVSGVLAVVTAGLFMSGPGRYRISPEVQHFLHQFWELLAYVANALIFFLVGAVISTQLGEMNLTTLAITVAAYLGIVVIRFVLTFGFLPLINRVGEPVSSGQATVMSWGGLRGAVSLALALAVSQHPSIERVLGDQILQVTAGVVLLTILVNGTSTGLLLRKLGFDQLPLSDRLAALRVESAVLASVADEVEQASRSPELRTVRWEAVRADVEARAAEARRRWAEAKEAFDRADPEARAMGLWRRALAVELQAYREASAAGTLGNAALDQLRREIDLHLDRIDRGDLRPPATRTAESKLRRVLARVARALGREFGGAEFTRLSQEYDLCRAEVQAAHEVRETMTKLRDADPQVVDRILATYAAYEREVKESLEDIRVNLPEVASAIETRIAHRIALNAERTAYEDALARGEIDAGQVEHALGDVRQRMKHLHFERPRVSIAETADLCRTTDLFAELPEDVIDQLAKMTVEQVLPPGEYLFRAGDRGDALYIIARGAVHVLDESGSLTGVTETSAAPLAVLTGGEILGEMALLTGAPRTAAARAATTVTLGRISRADFEALMQTRPEVRERVWQAYGRRVFDNVLRLDRHKASWVGTASRAWFCTGRAFSLLEGETPELDAARFAFVVHGRISKGSRTFDAPALIELDGEPLRAERPARLVLLGEPPFAGEADELDPMAASA
jgi:Na+/H+ antiporter